jgi:cysteine protease ATG4
MHPVRMTCVPCPGPPDRWVGPGNNHSALTGRVRSLVERNETRLRVYFTGDGPDVYQDRFMDVAKADGSTFTPTLILVGTRLGIDKITAVYWEALVAALQLPQSVGIAG